MQKFPSIEQFRQVVRVVRDAAKFNDTPLPKIRFTGTVKLHGTNAGVTWRAGEPLIYMSRNRTLAVGDDNAGFVAHMSQPEHEFWLKLAMAEIGQDNGIEPGIGTEITVFGEWCGQGIQKGVAITGLPKMYVIFAARADGRWLDISPMTDSPTSGIYSIRNFPTFTIDIDFNSPELSQNDMVAITEEVERECPVGKKFGVSGIGEGVVWSPEGAANTSRYWFKVKGEKHSTSRVSTLAPVDVERIQNRDALVDALVTDNRLAQALDFHLTENKLSIEMHNIGSFLRWVFADVAKEETDTIEASGFTVKELGKPISDVAKRFYMKSMDAADAALVKELQGLAA